MAVALDTERLRIGSRLLQNWLGELEEEIIRIAEIPSPTGHEQLRAQYVARRFSDYGWPEARLDDVGNVVLEIPGREQGAIVIAAHLDTVFEDQVISVKRSVEDSMIYAPGIGDNSAHVAALLFLARLISSAGWKPRRTLILVADVGEEGLGNLQGIRAVMDRESGRVAEVIALDGILGRVVDTAVGSRRYQTRITAQGGHSWQDFGATSAVQLLGELITLVYEMKVPARAKTTFNIGRVEGGTSVNTIPESAVFLVDLRSVDPQCLSEVEQAFLDIVRSHSHLPGYTLENTMVGNRPAGTIEGNAVLAGHIRLALEAMGLECTVSASSTDANYPTSLGIPSVTFGLFDGYNAHRPTECLNLKSLSPGMELLLRTWLSMDARDPISRS